MKSQDETEKRDGEPYFPDAIRDWYQKYQELDKLSLKLDDMVGQINYLRGLVEQKMKKLDRLFIPPCD